MTLVERINDYVGNGGLFNPEMMEHAKVRDLLLDCREALCELDRERVISRGALIDIRDHQWAAEEIALQALSKLGVKSPSAK